MLADVALALDHPAGDAERKLRLHPRPHFARQHELALSDLQRHLLRHDVERRMDAGFRLLAATRKREDERGGAGIGSGAGSGIRAGGHERLMRINLLEFVCLVCSIID